MGRAKIKSDRHSGQCVDTPADDIVGITAATGRGDLGSACEIVFRDPKSLQNARVKVKMLQRVANDKEGTEPIWLDRNKTRDELRPSRALHKLAECLSDLSSGRDVNIVKHQPSKTLQVEGEKAACILFSGGAIQVCWTARGEATWDQADRDLAAA